MPEEKKKDDEKSKVVVPPSPGSTTQVIVEGTPYEPPQMIRDKKEEPADPAPASKADLVKGVQKSLEATASLHGLTVDQLITLAASSQLRESWIPESEILDPNANPALRQLREASREKSDQPGGSPELAAAEDFETEADKKSTTKK